ncbi:MAG TPA: preprotein translocase subunit SecE [Brevibacterium senegalense]|uniref:Protein translocase subunit SecE n=1 Tax=Brevibacterium senegalense TaxID=1033736 RepID=A0A921MHB0_9MICO|nr:preprotein translocase subunit SecE [Brevibacterium senegalense]HJG81324.1 preprotein translocase subunit SecE [Brevibacterium senegalense]
MAETSAAEGKKRLGLFGRILRFFREIIAELKKVVTPTRKELINYTLVVLGFVVIMMLLITGLDFVFGQLTGWVFAGTTPF